MPDYYTILISAGHGGSDPGATSKDGKLVEAKLALRLRDRIAEILRTQQVPVITDGVDRQNVPLWSALKLMLRANGPRVELHFNAADNSRASGVEALALSPQQFLAKDLAKAVSIETGLPLRGDKGFKPDNAGQHSRLAFCQRGGVILELAFITNPNDMKAYLDNEEAIAVRLASVLEERARKLK